MMKAVVFDIGETLIDETRVWSALADWLQVPRMTLFAVLGGLISNGLDHRDLFEIVRPDIGWKGVASRFREEVGDAYIADDLYGDVRPALAALKSRGYVVGIAGNQPVHQEKQLREMNLPADFIATSAGWGLKKPDAGFFERIIQEVGYPPEQIAYVGDRVDNDVLPAAATGLVPVHIIRGPWGYLQQEWPGARRARIQIHSLTPLAELLPTW